MAKALPTRCLGLEVGDRSKKGLYLRSDDRAHTLYYSEGSPEDQTVGFEVEGSQLETAAATLESLGHPVHAGTPEECASRMVKAFIGFGIRLVTTSNWSYVPHTADDVIFRPVM